MVKTEFETHNGDLFSFQCFKDSSGWQLAYLVRRLDWLEKIRVVPML